MRLNLAENILWSCDTSVSSTAGARGLLNKEDDRIAVTEVREGNTEIKNISWGELRRRVEELAGALAKGWAAWDFGQRYHDAFGARSFGLIGLGVVCEMLERLEKLDGEAQDVDEGPGSQA